MSSVTSVSDLLARWAEARRRGQSVTAEDLCRDHPERLAELKQQIAVLEQIRPLLAGGGAGTATGDTWPAPPAVPTPPSATAGRYRAVRPHAHGGLGEVLIAEDEELSRPVALKRIREDYAFDPVCRRRFLREAEVTARLQHPGVVPVYGLTFDERGRPCYAMRFIEGESLDDAVKRFHTPAPSAGSPGERAVAFRQLLRRFVDVCNAVAYAHSRGIVHRDLKPANVMLGRFGETLVVDWGLAKPVGRPDAGRADGPESLIPVSDSGAVETEVGQAVGTPAYMSPEQAEGAWDELGLAADVFSLGATFYAILTGQAPYSGRPIAARDDARRCEFVLPRRVKPGVPPALEAICLKAMARAPQDRYPTALELAAEVERWLADEPVRAYPEPWPDRARRWVRRHRPLVAGAAAALAVGVVGLAAAAALLAAANGRERLARAETELQRDIAHEQKRRTRQALDDMTSQVTTDWLATQKTLLPQQTAFLQNALKYYREFAKEASTDQAGRELVANAHYRVGLMLQKLGDRAGAEAACRKSLELCERLAAEAPPAEPKFRRALATSHNNLGNLLTDPGRRAEAEAAYRRALELREQLVNDFPAEPAYRHDLARSFSNLGVQLQEQAQYDEAGAAYRQAIRLLEPLAQTLRADPAYRGDLASSLSNLAVLLYKLDKLPEAEVAHRRAVELRERLVGDFPSEPEYRGDLATSLSNLGVLLNGLRKLPEAEAAHRRAIELREQLRAYFPAVREYRSDLATSYSNRGVVLRRLRKLSEAEADYRRAIDQLRQLADEAGDVPEYRNRLAIGHTNLGNLLRELGQRPAAEAAYRQAVTLQEPLAAGAGGSAYAIDLGKTTYNLGAFLSDSGDPQGSLEWYAKAIATLQPTPAPDPESREVRLVLGLAHQGRANALGLLGQHVDALPDWDRAIALSDPPERVNLRLSRACALARAGRPAGAVAEAEALAGADAPGGILYDAACVYALASAAVRDDGPLAERHAVRAVALLRRAFARDYADVASLLSDGDLDVLRRRCDYTDLLWELADFTPQPMP
jgi:serine/threonine-protein kinase